jgi:hypothetical protein
MAKLKFDAHNVRVTLRDNATVELSGRVDEFGMNRSNDAMVVANGLLVGHNVENTVIETGKEALVGA